MFQSLLRLTKHSAIYGVGHVLSRSVVIFLLPLHTNLISKQEYGIATQLFAFMAIVAIIYSYGMNTAFLQFFMLEKKQKKQKEIFSTAYFATLASSILFSLVLVVSAGFVSRVLFGSPDYAHLIRISAGILSLDAMLLLSFNVLRALEKSVNYVAINLISVVINVFFNFYYISWANAGVTGIFYANLISSLATFFMLFPVTFKNLNWRFSKTRFKDMARFGLPFIPSTISIAMMSVIDRFFINKYMGLEAAGVYGAGYKLALIVNLMVTAFRFAWQPFFTSMADQKEAREVFARVFTYFALLSSYFFLLFLMFVDQLVRFKFFGFTLFGKEFWNCSEIVPVIVLAYIFYGFYLNFNVGIYLEEKTRYLMYINAAGALITIIGNALLIPPMQLMGAAYSALLAYGVMMALIYVVAQRIYYIRYEYGRLLRIVILTVFIFLLYEILELEFATLVKIGLLAVYTLFLFLSGFFEKREISKFKSIMKKSLWQN